MKEDYKQHHYVPQWYQKKFMLPGQTEYHYLDMDPEIYTDSRGNKHSANPISKCGTKKCFMEDDLYTTVINSISSKDIEKHFFGEIDRKGGFAVKYFEEFSYPMKDYENFLDEILTYISTQKLRTPKGLAWIRSEIRTKERNKTLAAMLEYTNMYSAIWTEAIWQIADATESQTKFIVSDHPVTVYNRACSPSSHWCRGTDDPDVWRQGTHTIFPLSLDKVLILTNLSWVRNPYGSPLTPRPNTRAFGSAMFSLKKIQIERHLNEQEVLEINYIIKRRAHRYLAAAEKERLYPENHLNKPDWKNLGHGYLLMPDPRPVFAGGSIIVGMRDGRSAKFDEYGRRPLENGFSKETDKGDEFKTLYRFKGDFAYLFGPTRRGRSIGSNGLEPKTDSESFHNHMLSYRTTKYKDRNPPGK
jgi:hypothetical protein